MSRKSMETIICDRCGTVEEATDHRVRQWGHVAFLRNMVSGLAMDGKSNVTDWPIKHDGSDAPEVCPGCLNYLQNWWKAGLPTLKDV